MAILAAARLAFFLGLAATAHVRAADVCTYQNLSLEQIARQAPVVIIGDVIREQPDGAGYDSTLRVRGVIKGRPPGPAVQLVDLGNPDDCTGGPRLTRGNRYVLFISGAPASNDQDVRYSLVDQDGGVYQLTPQGTRYPPDRAGDPSQLQPVSTADMVRNAGQVSGADPSRIEDLVSTLNLTDTVAAPAPPAAHHSWLPHSLPSQTLLLTIAGGAVMLAGLMYLLWQPPAPTGRR